MQHEAESVPIGHHTVGLLLAAGAGRRMGQSKALVDGWLVRTVEAMNSCHHTVVVLGAQAERAMDLVTDLDVEVVVADRWADGMSASLTAGLAYLEDSCETQIIRSLVMLVDLPDVGADVIERVLSHTSGTPESLARATYAGIAGHPVLLGRSHWSAICAQAAGDYGARDYLNQYDLLMVECGDLATGVDLDKA